MSAFATVQDMNQLFRPLTLAELNKAQALLDITSDELRQRAMLVGKDLDYMILNGELLPNVVKSVTVDIAARALMTPTNEAPMSQVSQSALGYSVSGTFLVPGGGLYVKKSELARLGLRRQRVGMVELYGNDKRHNCQFD